MEFPSHRHLCSLLSYHRKTSTEIQTGEEHHIQHQQQQQQQQEALIKEYRVSLLLAQSLKNCQK